MADPPHLDATLNHDEVDLNAKRTTCSSGYTPTTRFSPIDLTGRVLHSTGARQKYNLAVQRLNWRAARLKRQPAQICRFVTEYAHSPSHPGQNLSSATDAHHLGIKFRLPENNRSPAHDLHSKIVKEARSVRASHKRGRILRIANSTNEAFIDVLVSLGSKRLPYRCCEARRVAQ